MNKQQIAYLRFVIDQANNADMDIGLSVSVLETLLAERKELLSTCRTLGNLIRDLLPLISSDAIRDAGLQKRILSANEKAFKANQKAGTS